MSFRVEPCLPGHPKCYRGVCGACGRSAPGERALNTSIEVDHQDGIYQILFLCESCVTEWARALGLITQVDANVLREMNEALDATVKGQREKLEHFAHLEALLADAEAARASRAAAEFTPPPEDEPVPVIPGSLGVARRRK